MTNIIQRLIFSVLLLVFGITSFSQNIDISPKIKLTNKIPRFKFIGKNNYGYVVRRYGGQTQAIDIFDTNLNLVKTREYKLTSIDVLDVILQPDGGWLLILDPYKESLLLKAVQLNQDMRVTKKEIVLDTIPEKGEHIAKNFKIKPSSNEQFYLLYVPLYKNGALWGFKTLSVNKSMQVINKNLLNFDLISAFDFHSAKISNQGNAFMIFKNKQKNKDASPSIVKVFYAKGAKSYASYELNLGYKFYHSPKFAIDQNTQKLLFAGFYTSNLNNKKAGAGGLLIGHLNTLNGEIKSVKKPFKKQLIEDLTNKTDRKEGLDLYTFYTSKIIPKVNGGMAVITESFYKSQDEVYSPNPFSATSFSNYQSVDLYFYNDLMVFHYDSAYQQNEVKILRKKQASEEDNGRYSSYALVNSKNKLRLIYLDEITKSGNLVEYIINHKTLNNRNPILNVGQKEVRPITKLAKQTALNEVIVPSFLSNNYRLIKISY